MKITPYVLILALSACTGNLDNLKNIGKESDPTRFYAMTATVTKTEAPMAGQKVIGIGPVMTADYLDRSHIVIRKTPTELELGEFDRWAGKTDREIQRILAADVALLLGTERVVTSPWKSATSPDLSVEVMVDRFERDSDGKAKLSAQWQVLGDDGRAPLVYKRTELEKEAGAGYEQLATALSELTGQLAQQIADELRHQ